MASHKKKQLFHGISKHWQLYFFVQQIVKDKRKETYERSALLDLYEGNPLVAGGYGSQRASNVKNISISSCHNTLLLAQLAVSFVLPKSFAQIGRNVKLWCLFC